MGDRASFRAQGISYNNSRIAFRRKGEFKSTESPGPNWNVSEKSLVVGGDLNVSGSVTITSPAVLRNLGVSSDGSNYSYQAIHVANTRLPIFLPFLSPKAGWVSYLHSVYWGAEADANGFVEVALSDHAGNYSSTKLTIAGEDSAAIAAGATHSIGFYGWSEADNALALVGKGTLRWLLWMPFGITTVNKATVIVAISSYTEVPIEA